MAVITFEFSDKAYDVLEKMEDTEDLMAVKEALREDKSEPISHEEFWRGIES